MNQDQYLDAPTPRRQKPGGHGWMMMLCCVPMLIIAVALVATGAVSTSFLLYAVGCMAMMALMMRAMSGSDPHDGSG